MTHQYRIKLPICCYRVVYHFLVQPFTLQYDFFTLHTELSSWQNGIYLNQLLQSEGPSDASLQTSMGKKLPFLMFIKRVVNKFSHFGTVSDLRRRYIPTRKQHITDQQVSRKTKIQGKRKFNLHFFINYKINNIKYKQSINSVI